MDSTIPLLPPNMALRFSMAAWAACALLWLLLGFALDAVQISVLWLLGFSWLLAEYDALGAE